MSNSQNMKNIITISFLFLSNLINAQTIEARIDTKGKKFDGLCDQDEFYSLANGLGDQQEAICPVSNEELHNKVLQLKFLQENKKFKGKNVISVDVNCKGKVVNVESKFKDSNLNEQIRALFFSIGNFTPGKMEGKNVDCEILYSIEIKNGTVVIK
jgi:hypothetical protein